MQSSRSLETTPPASPDRRQYVTIARIPPSEGTIQTCGEPLMLEIKLTHFPSGEKLGLVALSTRAMRATNGFGNIFSLVNLLVRFSVGLLPGLACHHRCNAAEQDSKS